MRLDDGWNQIQFNLSDFTRRAYGTNYIETLRVQVESWRARSFLGPGEFPEMPVKLLLFKKRWCAQGAGKEEKQMPLWKAAPPDCCVIVG